MPSTIAATQGARPEQAGLASGLVNTSRQVGGAVGIALLISLASQRTSHLIGGNRAVPDALTDGFRLAYLSARGCAPSPRSRACLLLAAARTTRRGAALQLPLAVVAVLAGFVVRRLHPPAPRQADRRLHDAGRVQLRLGARPPPAEDHGRAAAADPRALAPAT